MTRLMLFKLLGNDVNRIGKALTEVDSIQQTFPGGYYILGVVLDTRFRDMVPGPWKSYCLEKKKKKRGHS